MWILKIVSDEYDVAQINGWILASRVKQEKKKKRVKQKDQNIILLLINMILENVARTCRNAGLLVLNPKTWEVYLTNRR